MDLLATPQPALPLPKKGPQTLWIIDVGLRALHGLCERYIESLFQRGTRNLLCPFARFFLWHPRFRFRFSHSRNKNISFCDRKRIRD